MRNRFYAFMIGRYGAYSGGLDTLSKWLFFASLGLTVTGIFLPHMSIARLIVNAVALGLFALVIFRFLSKNINARVQANMKFIRLLDNVLIILNIKSEGDKRIFRCPKCRAKVRVPKGKGKIRITCPKCRHEFIKKT